MNHHYFYEVFDHFFYLTLDDINEITGVKFLLKTNLQFLFVV